MSAYDIGRDALAARIGDAADNLVPAVVEQLGRALLAVADAGSFTELYVSVDYGPAGGVAWSLYLDPSTNA